MIRMNKETFEKIKMKENIYIVIGIENDRISALTQILPDELENDKLKFFYQHLGCNIVEALDIEINELDAVLVFDEEGALKSGNPVFSMYCENAKIRHMIAGTFIIALNKHTNEGIEFTGFPLGSKKKLLQLIQGIEKHPIKYVGTIS